MFLPFALVNVLSQLDKLCDALKGQNMTVMMMMLDFWSAFHSACRCAGLVFPLFLKMKRHIQ